MSAARLTLLETWLENLPSAEVRALDPRRHTLIEASAGTGKTFAVEHLVLRLLMENPEWVPEEILLLSFTEKTAADLRARIRALLHRQVRKPGPQDGPDKAPILGWSEEDKKRLHMLWTHADDLAVHTLHGFCQSSLRRDPLTSNVLIRDEVADDRAAADDALENLLRGSWAKDPVRLAKLRDALDIGGGEDWRKKLVGLALAWHPWRGDRLDPERDPGTLESLEQGVVEATHNLFAAAQEVENGSYTVSDFRRSFKTTKTAQTELSRHAYHKVFNFAQKTLADSRGAADTSKAALTFFRKSFTKASAVIKRGWESEIPTAATGLPEWRRLAAACEMLRNLDAQIEDARRLQKLGLRAEAAMELRAELGREKIRRGVISYDDMPANLVKALRKNSGLATRIRRRYKACIVDEFQDTDPVQWEILEALCLPKTGGENEEGRAPLPLFLVGDPKQAIYGFRGGDLRTYLAARSLFREMAATGRAQGFGLEANFRSRRTLIEALNATFAHADWFGTPAETPPDPAWRLPAESEHVAFTPARAGRADDSLPVPRVTLRDFAGMEGPAPGKPPKKSEVERAVRRWIVARIVAAVKAGRPPGDIAILVRRNNEGEAMERLLRRCGIPCRVRRRGGIFGGPAADALRLLLEWIDDAANPDAQARILLLPFARESTEDLPRGRPLECPPLIARWALLAKAGRWPEFFDSVRRESGYQDRLAAASPSEAERFDRLSRILAEAGSIPGTSVRSLCERFDSLRRGEGSGENGAESAGEGEDAVTLMTLHMSKGLEFPVIFLNAAGEGVRSSHYVLRPRGEPGFRIALDTKDPETAAEHDAQERGEEQRLFYVAFTRAKDELHLPLLPAAFARGESGPLGGFAADALRAAAASPETTTLFHWDTDPVPDLPEARTEARAVTHSDGSRDTGENGDTPDRRDLLAAAHEAFGRKRRLTSYSALAARGKTEVPKWIGEWIDEDGTRILREEPFLPSAEDTPEAITSVEHNHITAAELPAGAAAGTALHAILEHTVFASAAQTPDPEAWLNLPGHRERVEESLRRESVDPACAPAAARAVWNTLRMLLPDPAGGPSFRLSDLSQEDDYRHEVEFLLPFSSGSFLWGFIDLVFRHDGRYYLLDWKSNLLPAYDRDSVRRSMEAHQYDLQWKLYSVALDRWLKARLPGYDPATHFGGVHYLYLRGSAPDRFSGFSDRPTVQQLREDFPAEIARLLGAEIGAELVGAR